MRSPPPAYRPPGPARRLATNICHFGVKKSNISKYLKMVETQRNNWGLPSPCTGSRTKIFNAKMQKSVEKSAKQCKKFNLHVNSFRSSAGLYTFLLEDFFPSHFSPPRGKICHFATAFSYATQCIFWTIICAFLTHKNISKTMSCKFFQKCQKNTAKCRTKSKYGAKVQNRTVVYPVVHCC